MRKKKAPIMPITILVIMVGGALVVNGLMNNNQADDPTKFNKDQGKAVGNESATIPQAAMKETVSQIMGAKKNPKAPERKKVDIALDDTGDRPMVLAAAPKAAPKQNVPAPPPKDPNASSAGQWYRAGSGSSKG
jgi:hypothetical protein